MSHYLLRIADEYLVVEANSAVQAVSTDDVIEAFGLDEDGSAVEVWTLRGEPRVYQISTESVRIVKLV